MMLFAAVDWHALFFALFALVTCLAGLAVLFSNNIVHMAFYLIISLGASAGLFFLAGAEFIGAMQLMIYVGGTLVLLVFGVMLTAQARFVSLRTQAGEWALGLVLGGALLMVLLNAAFSVDRWREPHPSPETISLAAGQTTTQLGLGLTGIRIDRTEEPDARLRDGMSGYFLPFVIVSVHLLVVLIGAAYLARTKRRVGEPRL